MTRLSLLVNQYRQHERLSEAANAADFVLLVPDPSHATGLLSEVQRALLEPQPQRDPRAMEQLLNNLLQQIEGKDSGFVEAFRWALCAQLQGS